MLIILSFFLGLQTNAYAVDPFTVLAVANTTAQVISQVSEATGDVAASTQAMTDLYSEVDSDAQIAASGDKIIRDIEAADALAHEAGYSASEVDQLGHPNQQELKKVSGSIRAITQAVRAGKRVGKLAMKLVQKSQMAEVESAEIGKQQLAATYKLLEQANSANLAHQNEESRSLIERKKEIGAAKAWATEHGAQQFGKSGVWSFPVTEIVIEKAIETARKMNSPLLGLMTMVFLFRLVFYQFGFFGIPRYGELLRDVLICSLLLLVFPELIRAAMFVSKGLSDLLLSQSTLTVIEPPKVDYEKIGEPDWAVVGWALKVGIVWFGTMLNALTFAAINFVMNFGLAFMVMLMPIVIFCSQMLSFAVAWPIYIGGFLIMALWPVFWNLIGLAAQVAWTADNGGISMILYSIFFGILHLAAPLIGIKMLSGHGVHKSITEGAKAMVNPVGSAIKHGTDFKDGAKAGAAGDGVGLSHGKSEKSVGRLFGSMAGHIFKKTQGG